MKERPILFSAPMVMAILEGRKTMTRRIVKLPSKRDSFVVVERNGSRWPFQSDDGESDVCDDGNEHPYACPYGQLGDRLWVRETWRVGAWNEDEGKIAVDYFADGHCRREWLQVRDENLFARLWQQSTDEAIKALGQREWYTWEPGSSPCKWRPSIFMPCEFSRITLEITNVRVERLNDISESDAKAEGINEEEFYPDDGYPLCVGYTHEKEDKNKAYSLYTTRAKAFKNLWESINGLDSWNANPWVWVIEFKKISIK